MPYTGLELSDWAWLAGHQVLENDDGSDVSATSVLESPGLATMPRCFCTGSEEQTLSSLH